MTRLLFTARIVIASRRWIGPCLVMAIWISLVFSPGSESALARVAGLAMGHTIVGVWWTCLVGNVDEDAHRELVAAWFGGPGSMQRCRASAASLMHAVPACAVAGVLTYVFRKVGRSWPAELPPATAITLGGVALGTAIGTWLCRPVVRSQAVAVLGGCAASLGVAIAPPVHALVRRVGSGDAPFAYLALAVGAAAATASVAGAAAVATRRG